MIPIECPECHYSDWEYVVDVSPKKENITRLKMAMIREDTDTQVDFDIVLVRCNDCRFVFWVPESQATEHVETFL